MFACACVACPPWSGCVPVHTFILLDTQSLFFPLLTDLVHACILCCLDQPPPTSIFFSTHQKIEGLLQPWWGVWGLCCVVLFIYCTWFLFRLIVVCCQANGTWLALGKPSATILPSPCLASSFFTCWCLCWCLLVLVNCSQIFKASHHSGRLFRLIEASRTWLAAASHWQPLFPQLTWRHHFLHANVSTQVCGYCHDFYSISLN